MKITSQFDVSRFVGLLKEKNSGVLIDPAKPGFPAPLSEHVAYSARLEKGDVDRFYLWFENRKYSADKVHSKLTEMTDAARELERVASFADGSEATGKVPVDIRTTPGFEPMLVTDGIHSGPLYAIDGNHRIIARYFSG